MSINEKTAKEKIVKYARSIFDRGLTSGASANMSVRIDNGWVITPTNTCFGFLQEDELSVIDNDGNLIRGSKASKEFTLHKAMYDKRPQDNCIIHLHSTYATAWSCLPLDNLADCVPTYTPYLTMRLGAIACVPYFAPGDTGLAVAVGNIAAAHAGVIMANHGPIVSAKTIDACVYGIEELEESCKLAFMLDKKQARLLTEDQVNHLKQNTKT